MTSGSPRAHEDEAAFVELGQVGGAVAVRREEERALGTVPLGAAVRDGNGVPRRRHRRRGWCRAPRRCPASDRYRPTRGGGTSAGAGGTPASLARAGPGARRSAPRSRRRRIAAQGARGFAPGRRRIVVNPARMDAPAVLAVLTAIIAGIPASVAAAAVLAGLTAMRPAAPRSIRSRAGTGLGPGAEPAVAAAGRGAGRGFGRARDRTGFGPVGDRTGLEPGAVSGIGRRDAATDPRRGGGKSGSWRGRRHAAAAAAVRGGATPARGGPEPLAAAGGAGSRRAGVLSLRGSALSPRAAVPSSVLLATPRAGGGRAAVARAAVVRAPASPWWGAPAPAHTRARRGGAGARRAPRPPAEEAEAMVWAGGRRSSGEGGCLAQLVPAASTPADQVEP